MNFGIICEFNPFHSGHAYLFEQARLLGANNIVCAMSGNAVQRGELAMFDKYMRAEMATEGGADLVLELPFPWSASSAEYFATAGIKALYPYCDAIIFGSECGDIELLRTAASCALKPEFEKNFDVRKKRGEGAASAYFSLLEEKIGAKLSSNDLLGVEYIKAAKKNSLDLEFYTVKRQGSAYRDDTVHKGELPSASAIRRAINEGGELRFEGLDKHSAGIIARALEKGEFIDGEALGKAYLLYFRLCDSKALCECAEADGGIAERICSLSRESASYGELCDNLKTKRYTDAKLRRAMLFGITQVRRELLAQTPEYLYLLGANERGRALLSSVKKEKKASAIRLVTKPADAPRDVAQFECEERLNAIFTLALKAPKPQGDAYRKNAFIK